jgi:hypothetical protein
MTKAATIAAVLFALAASPAFAGSYSLDAKGKCHDDHGKFAKAEFCKAHTYKLDAKGKCHDESGKFAKGTFCHK